MARRLLQARTALPLATLATFLLMVLAPPAGAATFTVDSGADAHDLTAADRICDVDDGTEVVCTLRAAVEQANATIGDEAPTDDVVNVNVPAVQLSLAVGGVIAITSNIQINGVYSSQPTITQESPLSPGSGDRVFDITAGTVVGLDNLTISGGEANSGNDFFGGNIQSRGNLTIRNSTHRERLG